MPVTSTRPLTAAELIHDLGGEPETGMCRCPAHDDKNPSLHVSQRQGKPLVHCHAGCSQEDVIGALKSRGLWGGGDDLAAYERFRRASRILHDDTLPPDLAAYDRFRQALSILRAAAQADAGKPTAYLQTRGISTCPDTAMLLTAKVSRRLLERGFPAMVLPVVGAKGLQGAHVTWLNLKGVDKLSGTDTPRKTYGEIGGGYVALDPADEDKPLVVAEGIETALSAAQVTGLPAVAAVSAGNMAKVALPPCSEVIIAADNDKAGRRAAKKLMRRLLLRGTPVRIAVPDGPDKYDWNDALRSQEADAEALREAIMTARRYRPDGSIALGVEDFMMLEFPPREFLLKPWLTTASINMIHASRGVGKSMLAMAIGDAVGRGGSLLKWTCEKPVPVLYVDGELPGALLQKRLGWLRPQPTNAQLLIVNRDRVVKLKKTRLDLACEDDRELLDGLIEQNGIGLIILDSILTLFSSDTQRDAQPWVPVQDWAYKHRDAGRSVIFIHHDAKSGGPFGTMLREVQMDEVIQLKSDSKLKVGDDESAFRLLFTKARDQFGADTAPMVVRYSTPDGVLAWSHDSESADTRTRVFELISEGWTQADIATELGKTESAVSQHVKNLRADGKLKPRNPMHRAA